MEEEGEKESLSSFLMEREGEKESLSPFLMQKEGERELVLSKNSRDGDRNLEKNELEEEEKSCCDFFLGLASSFLVLVASLAFAPREGEGEKGRREENKSKVRNVRWQ